MIGVRRPMVDACGFSAATTSSFFDPDLFFLLKNMVRSWFDCLKMDACKRFLSHQCALVSMS